MADAKSRFKRPEPPRDPHPRTRRRAVRSRHGLSQPEQTRAEADTSRGRAHQVERDRPRPEAMKRLTIDIPRAFTSGLSLSVRAKERPSPML